MNGLVLLIASLVAVSQAADWYSCLWINNPEVDCTLFPDEEICGTNRMTYKNKCYFSKAHCADTSIALAHEGSCNTQTRPTADPVKGAAIAEDFMCSILSHRDCDPHKEPTCGSDGRTYVNLCEYQKAKCTHKNLHVLHFGDCSA